MKKKSIILVSSSVLVLVLGIGAYAYFNKENVPENAAPNAMAAAKPVKAEPSKPKVAVSSTIRQEKIEANHAIFENADQAEDQSDAVVRVTAAAVQETVLEEQAWGIEGRTMTEVEVLDTYKNSSQTIGDKLVVAEPYYVTKDENGNPVQFNYEHYEAMQEGREYILFLGWDETRSAYWINALEQGQHPVEEKQAAVNEQYSKLRQSAIDKYLN